MNNKVIQHAQPLVRGDVPSVMNHGDDRHFGPYERLGSISGAAGISVIVRVDSVLRQGIRRSMCLVPANIPSMTPQDPKIRTEGAVWPRNVAF
jgi:hypothetical protein